MAQSFKKLMAKLPPKQRKRIQKRTAQLSRAIPLTRCAFLVPKKKAESLMRNAMKVATGVRTDQLDCRVSFARQATIKTPEEVLMMAVQAKPGQFLHWSCIMREAIADRPAYGDFGCSVSDPADHHVEYLLWITVPPAAAMKVVEKHRLQPL